jgi:hypothetical protein
MPSVDVATRPIAPVRATVLIATFPWWRGLGECSPYLFWTDKQPSAAIEDYVALYPDRIDAVDERE